MIMKEVLQPENEIKNPSPVVIFVLLKYLTFALVTFTSRSVSCSKVIKDLSNV